MFKKTKPSQVNLFSSPSSFLTGKTQKIYDDKNAWHNVFREQVTLKINEKAFEPLFCKDNGTPNASIRVLIAMMILKESEGLSDQKIFENSRFNLLTRSAIGLMNAQDAVPSDSTYYLLRKKILDYAKQGNENLLDTVFSQVTNNQSIEFEVSGRRTRMDSKLFNSNISWLSRYELIHETLRLFYKDIKDSSKLSATTKALLDDLLKLEGNKIVYTCSSDEVKTRLQQLGILIHSILELFSAKDSIYYQTLEKVFEQQYELDQEKIVIGREKEKISAQSIQSPHDTDCTYRNKDGNKIKGYTINITESCDDGQELNLIGSVDVRKASTADTVFLEENINKIQSVFIGKTEIIHADGAYHSTDNQQFCNKNNIELYLHAIQGGKGRFELNVLQDNKLTVLDTSINETIHYDQVIAKDGTLKWRIKTEKGYRYFTQKDIDTCAIRKKIAQTPIEILQKRNNVEATVFQLGYHYSNAKTRYRGLIKHQMWANIRCMWVNFVRILNFKVKNLLKHKLALSLLLFLEIISFWELLINRLHENILSREESIEFSRRWFEEKIA